jgi:hypothetical protein
MNMDKVEAVIIDQSSRKRLLGYSSIHIRGTGEGLEELDYPKHDNGQITPDAVFSRVLSDPPRCHFG